MSATQIVCHIVFTTKFRAKTIPLDCKRKLYAYIHGIIKNMGCTTLRINGMEDHIHLLVDVHPTISISHLVKTVKQYSSLWLRENPEFPNFYKWNEGYYAASVSDSNLHAVKEYIIQQEQHHNGNDVLAELKALHDEIHKDFIERSATRSGVEGVV